MLKLAVTAILIVAAVGVPPSVAQEALDIDEVRAIAEEAYLYGLPMIVGYKVIHDFFIDRNSAQFKAPINEISNEARVFTHKDTGVSSPNSARRTPWC